jgi:hypothetical protein
MTQFRWDRVTPAMAKDVGEVLGLGRRSAAQKLALAWPNGPDEEVVRRCWPMLLDRWATRHPQFRNQLVAELRAHGLGDDALIGRTASSRNDYLRSCHNGRTLRRIVLALILASQAEAAESGRPAAPSSGSPLGARSQKRLDAKIATAWTDLTRRMAAALGEGQDGDTVTVELAHADVVSEHGARQSNRFVQWVHFGISIRCESVGNASLPEQLRLSKKLLAQLIDLGWQAALPDDDSVNFWIERPQTDAQDLADVLARTLRDVYGAPHPAFLQARGFNGQHALNTDQLGIPSAAGHYAPAPEEENAYPDRVLTQRVVATLSEDLGCSPDELVTDSDGDYPIRSGSAMVFVQVFEEADLIVLMSPLLKDVSDSPQLRLALDNIQAQVPFVQLSLEEGIVTARAHLIGDRFVPLHLHRLLGMMSRLCDDVDTKLQKEFGGTTFFGRRLQPTTSTDGGYL